MQTKTLGEICRPKQWKTVATSQLSEEGYPVYGANGIIGKYKEYNHENETILVTCRGATCGALNICEPFSYVNGNAMALDNLNQSIDLKYLYYFLKGRGFHDVISGSAQPQIIRSAIERIEVPICDIGTQKEITKSFVEIEKLIESKKKILANLDNLVKARFVEMFGDKNTADSVLIGEAVELINGRAFKPTDWTVSGLPIIRIQNLNDPKAPYNHFDGSYDKKNYVEKGELLFSWSGTPGTSFGAFIWDREPGLLNQHIFRVLPKKDYDLKFLRFALNAQLDEIISKAHGGVGLQHITKSELEKISIPHPSRERQAVFSNFVAQVDKSKFDVQKSLEKTQQLFDKLMQGYFG